MIFYQVGLAALIAGSALQAGTTAAQEPARVMEIAVAMPEKITQGEPLVATVTIANGAGSAAEVDLGWNRVGAFEIEVQRPDGARVTGKAEPPLLGGISRLPKVVIETNTRLSQSLPLSDWVDFRTVGRYEIVVRFNGTVLSNKKTDIATLKEWRRTVDVGSRDPSLLTALCERLSTAILQTANIDQQMQNATRLSGVRDPIAVPFMKRVAQAGKVEGPMIEGLVAVGTPNAREALVELSQDKDPDVAALARSALKRFALR